MTIRKDVKTTLTDEMRYRLGGEIAEHTVRYDELEAAKKEATKDLTAKMKLERADWTRKAKALRTGVLDEVVECEEIQDFDRNQVTTRRCDNGEQVAERAMTGEERQTKIDFDGDGVAPEVAPTKGKRQRLTKVVTGETQQ